MNLKTSMDRAPAHSMSGMSLVEILVAMLIGLIGMVIITQVYSVSEERKRTTTGVGDAQVTGNIAMFTLERELRAAGFGMVSAASNMLGCVTTAFDSVRTPSALAFPLMAPVQIAVGAGGAPDSLTVIYGNSATAIEGSAFRAPETNAPFPLKNAAGFNVGDLVVASDAGACTVAEVTGFTVGALNDVEHVNNVPYSYTAPNGATVNVAHATHNPLVTGALPSSALLFSLGRSPVVRTYLVANDKLKTQSLFPYLSAQDPDNNGWSDTEIADGVVQLKAQYGKDTNKDGIVDTWNTATPPIAPAPVGAPTTPEQWLQVRAIKVAMVARSAQYKQPPAIANPANPPLTADCVWPTFPNPPYPAANSVYWSGGCFTMTNPTDGTDWHGYRYRVYETIIPLRNMIWSTD